MNEFREALQNAHIMASPNALQEMCAAATLPERLFCSDFHWPFTGQGIAATI